MPRVKRGVNTHKKHKNLLKLTKKFNQRRRNTIKIAKQALLKANQYSYIDRKKKKRFFKKIWIININLFVRQNGMTYSYFIKKFKNLNFKFNKKILFFIINNNNKLFNYIISIIKLNYEFNK